MMKVVDSFFFNLEHLINQDTKFENCEWISYYDVNAV